MTAGIHPYTSSSVPLGRNIFSGNGELRGGQWYLGTYSLYKTNKKKISQLIHKYLFNRNHVNISEPSDIKDKHVR